VPEQAKELALLVEDPDAPRAEPFVYWILYKIPADSPGLPVGLPHQTKLADPPGVLQGVNSFDKIGYDGPAPPRGHGAHHYHFRLFALDQPLDVEGGMSKDALLGEIAGHVLDEGDLIATYER
jgi:Raf kinase inhibitor-like YbhB/YbcL family protein